MSFNEDNDESRRAVESCYRTKKTLVNPIIDWSNEDVWEFIAKYKLPYCELYDQGFKRLGCIGCPMQGPRGMVRDFEKWPKYKDNYIRAFDRMLANRDGMKNTSAGADWTTAKSVYEWWIGEPEEAEQEMDGQIAIGRR